MTCWKGRQNSRQKKDGRIRNTEAGEEKRGREKRKEGAEEREQKGDWKERMTKGWM